MYSPVVQDPDKKVILRFPHESTYLLQKLIDNFNQIILLDGNCDRLLLKRGYQKLRNLRGHFYTSPFVLVIAKKSIAKRKEILGIGLLDRNMWTDPNKIEEKKRVVGEIFSKLSPSDRVFEIGRNGGETMIAMQGL